MFKTIFTSRLSIILVIAILTACSSERSRFAAGVYHTQKKKTSGTAIKQKEKDPAKASDATASKETDPIVEPQAIIEEAQAQIETKAAPTGKEQGQAKILKSSNTAKAVSTKEARKVLQQLKKEYKPSAKSSAQDTAETNGRERSWLIALLLCFFLGGIGIHRFYLGYIWQGVVQVLTLGCCGVWTLIDFIRIITRDLVPKGGDYND